MIERAHNQQQQQNIAYGMRTYKQNNEQRKNVEFCRLCVS